ncbi:hypothetical protein AV530_020115 [Patagioenas fasciata monilis]|uniref:Uncharacterized protein n=1 Tax=Patagioenas fasciata monilis TaxID=372326 RepID=A0A1V4JI36_PATFA|nr:hypothetical protein AV530_020115 [Patagioenas fasciata monilis]
MSLSPVPRVGTGTPGKALPGHFILKCAAAGTRWGFWVTQSYSGNSAEDNNDIKTRQRGSPSSQASLWIWLQGALCLCSEHKPTLAVPFAFAFRLLLRSEHTESPFPTAGPSPPRRAMDPCKPGKAESRSAL